MKIKQVQVLKSVYHFNSPNWLLVNDEVFYYSVEQYKNTVSAKTIDWFRRLGSKQNVYYAQTSAGRQIVEMHSVAPDNSEKHVYKFHFIF